MPDVKVMSAAKSSLEKRAQGVSLIAMDVDGVLTGGEIVILESGEEVKFWNAKDRLGMALIRTRKLPVELAWITGRGSRAVEWAARDLGVKHVVQNCHDKHQAMEKILKKLDLSYDRAAFIGDDLIDLPVLTRVGFAACPRDAASDVVRACHYVSPHLGGRGVVRDVLEFVLRAKKSWEPVVQSFQS